MKQRKCVVLAWALVDDETGRLALSDFTPLFSERSKIESPAIYMTKSAAKRSRRHDERIVKVSITDIE